MKTFTTSKRGATAPASGSLSPTVPSSRPVRVRWASLTVISGSPRSEPLESTGRPYGEAVRDKHADTREVIRANQAATGGRQGVIGKPPFGYRITGTKLNKRFE